MQDEDRWRWARYALAALLGVTMLGLTYTLFDPELGTDVPLYQEFTCRGRLVVTATDPVGRSMLRVPEMALKMTATGDGELRPSRFTVHWREGSSGAWKEYFSVTVPAGEHLMYFTPVTNETQAYVEAKDLEGRHCKGESGIVGVPLEPPVDGTAPSTA